MVHDEHLIELYLTGKRIGSGLRIARTFALTTAHSLGHDVLTAKPTLHLRDGTPAYILWGNIPSDLALLRLELNGTTGPDRGYGSVRPQWTRTDPGRRPRRSPEGS